MYNADLYNMYNTKIFGSDIDFNDDAICLLLRTPTVITQRENSMSEAG